MEPRVTRAPAIGAALSAGSDLTDTVRACLLRWVSACLATRIHVSAMSENWLRMHASEYDKHRSER
jgi:hypothetical protein